MEYNFRHMAGDGPTTRRLCTGRNGFECLHPKRPVKVACKEMREGVRIYRNWCKSSHEYGSPYQVFEPTCPSIFMLAYLLILLVALQLSTITSGQKRKYSQRRPQPVFNAPPCVGCVGCPYFYMRTKKRDGRCKKCREDARNSRARTEHRSSSEERATESSQLRERAAGRMWDGWWQYRADGPHARWTLEGQAQAWGGRGLSVAPGSWEGDFPRMSFAAEEELHEPREIDSDTASEASDVVWPDDAAAMRQQFPCEDSSNGYGGADQGAACDEVHWTWRSVEEHFAVLRRLQPPTQRLPSGEPTSTCPYVGQGQRLSGAPTASACASARAISSGLARPTSRAVAKAYDKAVKEYRLPKAGP